MIRLPVIATVGLAKLAATATKATGRGDGSALPGLVAERLDPNIAAKLARFRQGTILVTGTNGKTTTTKLLARMLTDAGHSVVVNRAGSNLYRGVVSSLVQQANSSGRVVADYGLFEVDEASIPRIAAALNPKLIVVLNLFRDQLDRYGELDTIAKLIGGGLSSSQADLVLYADDPLVASLAEYLPDGRSVTYAGLSDLPLPALKHDVTADSITAPNGSPLDYSQRFFGHVGHYAAKDGSFKRPSPQVSASQIKLTAGSSSATIKQGNQTAKLNLQLPGVYNLSNALMAITAGTQLGIDLATATASAGKVEAAFGRVETLEYKGRHLHLSLVKNPTGFNQVIQTFLMGQPQDVLFCINDNYADSRDVSWLWDVAIEDLTSKQHRMSCAGLRGPDMTLRLKYADIAANTVADLDTWVDSLAPGATGYVVPTYTAMLALRAQITGGTAMQGVES